MSESQVPFCVGTVFLDDTDLSDLFPSLIMEIEGNVIHVVDLKRECPSDNVHVRNLYFTKDRFQASFQIACTDSYLMAYIEGQKRHLALRGDVELQRFTAQAEYFMECVERSRKK